MVKIKLVPYKIKIRNTRVRREKVYFNLNDIKFIELFKEFITSGKSYVNEEDNVYFEGKGIAYNEKDDVYFGKLGYGDFGYNSEIKNVRTNETTKKKIAIETEEIPYFYLLKIVGEYAIICINQFKRRGVKGILTDEFREFLKYRSPVLNMGAFSLSINPMTSYDLSRIHKIENIRYIRERTPRASEGGIMRTLGIYSPKPISEEHVIKIKSSGKLKDQIVKIFKKAISNNDSKKFLELDGELYKTMKMEVELEGGSKRTLSIEHGILFSEGEEMEFEGDFPKLQEFYDRSIGYLKDVVEDD